LIPSASTNKALVVKGVTSQTSNIFEAQDPTGTNVFASILSGGSIRGFAGIYANNAQNSAQNALFVLNSVASSVAAVVKGAASQSGNLQEWQDSAGALLAKTDFGGSIYTGANIIAGSTSSAAGRLTLFTASASSLGAIILGKASQTADLAQYQTSASAVLGGRNALGQIYTGSTTTLKGATTAVTAASASSATVATYTYAGTTQLVAVGQLVTTAGFTAETYFNGTFAVTAIGGSSGAWTFTVVGSGFTVASATVMGTFQLPAQASITPSSAGTRGLVIQGATNQSTYLQEWLNSAGTSLVNVDQSGNLTSQALITGVTRAGFAAAYGGSLNVLAYGVAQQGVVVRGASGQTADLQQLQLTGGTVLGGRNALAQIYSGSTVPILTAVGGATVSIATSTGTVTITMTSATNAAVGDLITVAGVTPTGYNGTFVVTAVSNTSPFTVSYANATTGAQTVAGTVSLPAQASVTARSAGTTGLVVRAASGQTSNIAEWQSSAGTATAKVSSSGFLNASGLATFNGYSFIQEENSGAYLRLTKQTAAAANPASGQAKLYLRDGTTGGTLKLVIRAGAAGAETTILDNIPQ
jgi:hypothetical protein